MTHFPLLFAFLCSAAVYANYPLTLTNVSLEDSLLHQLVLEVFNSKYGRDCALVVSTDEPKFSASMQDIMIRQSQLYLALMTLKKTEFTHSYYDYSWLVNEKELMDFRSIPPELQSRVWPGGTFCNFHLMIASSTTKFPQLVINTLASVRLRPFHDRFLFHFRPGLEPLDPVLTGAPAYSIRFQMVTRMYPETQSLQMMTICPYCIRGGHHGVLQTGYFDPNRRHHFETYYGNRPVRLNGKIWMVVFYEEIDIDGARDRKKKYGGNYLTPFERTLMLLEELGDCKLDFYLKEITRAEIEFQHPNGTWDGMIGEVQREKADIIMLMGFTPEISRAIFLTPPVIYTQKKFLTRMPRGVITWLVIFRPYETTVWLVLLTYIFTAAFAFYVLGKIKHHISFKFAIAYILRDLIEQPKTVPRVSVFRALGSVLLFLSIVIVCGYKAKLVAYLTWPPREPLPETFYELLFSTFRWGLSMLEFVLIRNCATLSGIKHLITIMENPVMFQKRADCIRKTLTEDFACVGVDLLLIRELYHFIDDEGNCIVRFNEEAVLQSYYSAAASRGDPMNMQLYKWVFILFESGLIDKFLGDEFFTNFIANLEEIRNENYRDIRKDLILTVTKLKGMFQVWLTGITISALTLILELKIRRCTKKKRKLNQSP